MDITDQKAWERSMTSLGVSRFRAQEEKAKEGGRYADTSAGARLIRVYLTQVSEKIAETINTPRNHGGRRMHMKLLQGIDYDKLAFFTLNRMMQSVFDPQTLQATARKIGQMVEDELRFSKFEIETPEFFNAVVRDLDARNSTQYQHRHRVLVNRMNDREIEWQCWTETTQVQVGLILLGCAMEASDLFEKKQDGRRGMVTLVPSAECEEWIKAHDEAMEVMFPDRMPCLIEPNDWQDWKDGGFFTNRMRGKTPMVKTRAGQQRDTQAPLLDSAAMPTVYDSVNAMQRTSWAVNKPLLEVVREVWDRGLEVGMPRSQPYEIPPAPIPEGKKSGDLHGAEKQAFMDWKEEARTLHGMEADRKAAVMGVVRSMRMASRMDHLELLWFVYQLDFRSRTYSTSAGVSPQGSDIAKALLNFGTAEPLGERGFYWFQVHGANKYGFDKGDYDERVRWVQDRAADIIDAGTDPLGRTDVWKDADKPFQFLAWCMEYAAAHRDVRDPREYRSRLPIALDGSCNGLQHFSAMLRDPVGGRSVNLVPGSRPSDIYQDVADVATEELRDILTRPDAEDYTLAANWMACFGDKGMGRKLAKKPVMTLPYGSTLQTCTKSVHAWVLENAKDFFPDGTAFKHSMWLSKVLWRSISKVVIAARAAMDWIQRCARILAKHDEPMIYTTPVGFPMVQFAPNIEQTRIAAQIGGRVKLTINTEMPGVNQYKASSGSSPNLVHSVDAAHMHMVVAEGARQGLTHFAMIHDDFGVHARHVDLWHSIIREQFIKLHGETDVLAEFKRQQEERTGLTLPDLPERGNLDLEAVRKSLYFFG
ncbi:RNA polymerase [Paracoccus phage ParKuw1]|uniref:DNA-directed RNA polymerase n=1 Tax=Paracoccus phage ParKuw1 TaxID=3032415 RepID=A0AAF0FKY6_9CAUD|nr:RNA polymerase [Paracoccus phage ParKuw1]